MKTSTKSFKKAPAILAAFTLSAALLMSGSSFSMKASAASEPGAWQADFSTIEEAHEYATELNNELMGEGCVLMKNNNDVLPLAKGTAISVVGTRSYDIVTGGTGSGSGGGIKVDMPEAMNRAGFRVNGKMAPLYAGVNSKATIAADIWGSVTVTVETDPSILKPVEDSIKMYDTVIWTIARTGGEGADLFTHSLSTNKDPTKHLLELDDNELATLDYLTELKEQGIIKNVVVLMNVANVMEMGVLEESDTIDSILWIGQPGPEGLEGVGRVLNGEYTPSGRTVDIWTADHTLDPTWQNFSDYSQFSYDEETGTYTQDNVRGINDMVNAEGEVVSGTAVVEYEEGIYLGYKYYETAAAEAEAGNYDGFVYDDQVVYPFGYGLSYTTFEQELITTGEEIQTAINAASGLDTKVQVKVKVTNTGNVAGKEVAQLYVHAPYTKGGIEKAEVALVSFAKTDILQPGESQELTLDVRLGDIASFDYNDANENGYKGWEIEAGAYEFRLQQNSHVELDSISATLTVKTTALDNDGDATNNTPLSNGDDYDSLRNLKEEDSESTMVQMSRADFKGTFPTFPTLEERYYGEAILKAMKYENGQAGDKNGENREYRYNGLYNSSDDEATDPYYKTVEDIPEGWTQATAEDEAKRVDGKTAVQLAEMCGYDYWSDEEITSGPYAGKTEAEAWVEFVNQLTYDELEYLVSHGMYLTAGLESVGKDQATDQDGPAQLKSNGYTFCCSMVISSTWNVDLAYEEGRIVGNDSLFTDTPGWYAPSMNIHRSPFSGRNFEYYSQDALQSGFIGAAVTAGYQSKGGYVYLKHYAINDQEADRENCATFVNEQAARENYLKTFEYSVKDGGALGIMTSFNRVGIVPEAGNYVTMQTIATQEWGFKGQSITDYYSPNMGKANYVIRGGVRPLGNWDSGNSLTGEWDATLRDGKGNVRDGNAVEGVMPESSTQYYAVRDTATRVLWVASASNVVTNGYNLDEFANQTVTLVQGLNGSANIAADPAAVGTDNIRYEISGGSLPEGLTMSGGTISGTPAKAGSSNVTIKLVADDWITKTANITVNVVPAADITENENGTYNVKVSDAVEIAEKEPTTSDPVGTKAITGAALEVTVPAGMTYDAQTGVISGTPTAAGIQEINVKVVLTVKEVVSNWWWNQVNTYTIELDNIITVGEPAPEPEEIIFQVADGKLQYSTNNGESWNDIAATGSGSGEAGADGVGIAKIEKTSSDGLVDTYTITLTDNTTYTFTVTNGANGVDGADGQDGQDGEQGPKGDKGDKGDPGEAGGCGGSIVSTSVTVGSLVLVAAAAVVALKLRSAKRK